MNRARLLAIALSIAFVALMVRAPAARAATNVGSCNEATFRTAVTNVLTGSSTNPVTFACSGTITLTTGGGGPISVPGGKGLVIDGVGQLVTLSGGGAIQLFS